MNNLFINIFCFFSIICFAAQLHARPEPVTKHIVVAMPYQPGLPYDPHWYTPEYVDYITSLLPKRGYKVTGYFVSLNNIPQFLDDMEAKYQEHKNICVLNFCDGGEWDGYPGISFTKQWEKHPISKNVAFSGADAKFILNSDDKTVMRAHIAKANLKVMPQALVPPIGLVKGELLDLLKREGLSDSWPLFCKLNIGAGALGISSASVCHNIDELVSQLDKMHDLFPKSDVIVQPYLVGPEYTILVLKNRVYAAVRRDFLNQFNLMESDTLTGLKPVEEEIKYLPAPEYAKELALKAIQAIPGTHHYSRIDLREDGRGNTYVLDINDRPGFGEPSTVNCMLQFNEISAAQLLQDIVKTSPIHSEE